MAGTERPNSSEELANAIAVVGMALRVPGASTAEAYWRNLRDGVESITQLGEDDLRAAGVSEGQLADPDYVRAGAFLEGIEQWDAPFFGFNPREASVMDPQHRLFLECAWEAIELAGHRPDRFDGAIGIFAGAGMGSYFWRNVLGHADLVRDTGFFLLRHTGNDKDFLATRVSYCFDLRGPSLTVQTACSTSLVAIHLASQSLLNGECDLALAGGVTIEVPHRQGYVWKEGEILSPDGHCRPFDAAAGGTVFGSGAAVVALRRLEDALASGDTIHAIVRGSAVNNDGSTKVGYLAPSVDGQAAAIAEALAVSGVDADTIGFVEAHGTGTAVGDPIEAAALTQAFRQSTLRRRFCALGSVKSNLGHLDTAAGAAGFIKVVQALRHAAIPPTLHFTDPHPDIDWEAGPFYVNATLQPWPEGDGPRRAGVSSLGVGGTNAHVVVEEAPAAAPGDAGRGAQLLLLSGRSGGVVERRGADLVEWFEAHPDAALADVAYTLSAGRTEFRYRRFVVADTVERAVDALLDPGHGAPVDAGPGQRRVAFLFAGGGTQYAGMGVDLYGHEPVYRRALDESLALAARHAGRDLRDLVLAPAGERTAASRELERPSLALPALFATQYALAQLLLSWGIEPAAMIGHSMGEYTAACLAGVFSLEDAMAIVALRGRLFEEVERGAMTSVSLSADALAPLLGEGLSIAAINGPDLCVASGRIAAIEALETTLAERGTEFRRIHIDTAAHSALLEPILDEFRSAFAKVRFQAPARPFVSNLSGDWATAEQVCNADYWVRHLRETVRFSEGLSRLFREEDVALVEIGPGRTLATLSRIHPERSGQEALTTMPHPEDDTPGREMLLATVGRLWQLGAAVDWDRYWADERRLRLPLPTYPFERAPHWLDPVAGEVAEAPGLFHGVRWEIGDEPVGALPDRVLIFRDRDGRGDAVADRIRRAGGRALVVDPGRGFVREGDRYTIDPDSPADYERLVSTLEAGRTTVLHLWTVDPSNDGAPREGERDAFHRPLYLLQALAGLDADHTVDLCFVTAGAVGITDAPSRPLNALLTGPSRVAPRELPNVRTKLVDIRADRGPGHRLAARLCTELSGGWDDAVVALRGVGRWVQRFGAMHLPAPDAGRLVRNGAVVLITGGTGGIGRTVAARLFRDAGARLVLVSRHGGDAEAREAIRALEAEGAEILVETADVTDPEAMTAVVRRALGRFGAVHGVIHGAGRLDDEPLALKSHAAADAVLAPKVRGALALDAATADLELDFFVVFSSRSAVTGAPGQVDYTAANAFLDAFVQARAERTGQPSLSVAWDAWRDVGMAADLARTAAAGGWLEDSHPVLRRRRRQGRTLVLEGRLDAAKDWVVREHRVRDGDAILPGSAYVDLARAAHERKTGAPGVQLRDLMLIAPLALNGAPRSVRVRLEEDSDGDAFTLLSRAEPEDRWIVHARGHVTHSAANAATHDLGALRQRCPDVRRNDGIVPHPHLAFGRRWSSLLSLALGSGEALAELELPEEFAEDLDAWGMHPALIDLATGAAQPLIPDYDPDSDFYVPASYGSVTTFGPLPRRVVSHIRYRAAGPGKDLAVFDVVVMDEAGTEVAVFDEFTMVRVANRSEVEQALAHAPSEPAAEASWPVAAPDLSHALSSEQGAEAFARLLVRGIPSHVLVSTRTPAAWLAEIAPPAPARPRAPKVDLPDLTPVEAALDAHEAVHEAAAVAYPEGQGRTRIVAFVVYQEGQRATVSELRRFVRARTSDALVPNSFVELPALPRTPDGGIDRDALPNPFSRADDHVAPRTPTEKTIAGIWRGLLGVERIGAHDNFLDIGGHSLLGVRALLQIEKATGVRLQPTALSLQTLAQLAAECDRAAANGADETGNGSVPRRLFSAVRQALKGNG